MMENEKRGILAELFRLLETYEPERQPLIGIPGDRRDETRPPVTR
jgi:hypothetical protein